MPEDKVRKIELPRLDPKEVGLLVIDMQNGFCHPEGARAKAFGVDAIAMPRASIPNVVGMMRLCRSAGVRITLTRQVHYPDDQARKRRRIPSHLDRRGVKLELCWRGTWDSELIDEIKNEVRPEDDVIIKHRASAFYNTPLEAELRIKGIQVLIITGTTTSFCIDSTIRDAYMRDYDVLVPAECVSDTDQSAHDAVLASVDRFHGLVTSTPDIARALGVASPVLA
ncbi:MAG TPA: isochorismatase family cysteine hydrolase [Candidatus Limnocylindria bacterium]|jgi:ureidoacrylate peracid hydrolase|nr:isochorismatase family cysteine hydrolase [Candidatus Limnocylindria bacterium]